MFFELSCRVHLLCFSDNSVLDSFERTKMKTYKSNKKENRYGTDITAAAVGKM
jgi:hypothetical protein